MSGKETRAENSAKTGKAARPANSGKRWRKYRRNGCAVLFAPDGSKYYGTRQEIRDACLHPKERKRLAEYLRFEHGYLKNILTDDEMKAGITERRRDSILFGAMRRDDDITISCELYIKLCAAARLVLGKGASVNEYAARVLHREIEAVLDVAAEKTGKRELPLTRYERNFLNRHKARQAC